MQNDFDWRARTHAWSLSRFAGDSHELLSSLSQFFAGSDRVTHREFVTFMENLYWNQEDFPYQVAWVSEQLSGAQLAYTFGTKRYPLDKSMPAELALSPIWQHVISSSPADRVHFLARDFFNDQQGPWLLFSRRTQTQAGVLLLLQRLEDYVEAALPTRSGAGVDIRVFNARSGETQYVHAPGERGSLSLAVPWVRETAFYRTATCLRGICPITDEQFDLQIAMTPSPAFFEKHLWLASTLLNSGLLLLFAAGLSLAYNRLMSANERSSSMAKELKSLVKQNVHGMVVRSPEGETLYTNPAARTMLPGSTETLFHAIEGDALVDIQRPGGGEGVAEVTTVPTQWEGRPALFLTLQDITDRVQARAQADFLADHDSLTQLPNRVTFTRRLQVAVDESVRQEQPLAVVSLGLDQFEKINESLGPQASDQALAEAGHRLAECVGEGALVCRLDGEQFGLLVRSLPNALRVKTLMRRIFKAFDTPLEVSGHSVYLTLSAGMATFPADGNSAEALLQNAGKALRQARGEPGHRWVFYQPDFNAFTLRHLQLEGDLHKALKNREFELFYQPLMSTTNSGLAICGVEALIRWRHPQQGLISPGEFIPLLESSGRILAVGDWVLEEACRQLAAWERENVWIPQVAVNLAASSFQQPNLASSIKKVLRRYRLSPDRLCVELTESSLIKDPDTTIGQLKAIRKLGVAVAIDDFGTGYSSLSYLKRFKVDKLKVDKAFVQELPHDQENAALVRATLAMAKALGMTVVAEGVETEAQRGFLVELQCDFLQGFLFSRPLPAHELQQHFTAEVPENPEGAR